MTCSALKVNMRLFTICSIMTDAQTIYHIMQLPSVPGLLFSQQVFEDIS
jgi:hypothetical protein